MTLRMYPVTFEFLRASTLRPEYVEASSAGKSSEIILSRLLLELKDILSAVERSG